MHTFSKRNKQEAPLEKTEEEHAEPGFQWDGQGGAGSSSSDEGGGLPAGSDNDSLFSFLGESHLQEAQEFRRRGFNSQIPEVDLRLLTTLRTTLNDARTHLSLRKSVEGPLGTQWLLDQTDKIERLIVTLSDEVIQRWVKEALSGKITGEAEEGEPGSRRRAQSLVRRLESTLQTLIRVVHILRAIDDHSTPEKRKELLVTEFAGAFSSEDITSVMQALERMTSEASGYIAWTSLMQVRSAAWESDKRTAINTMVETARHEAEKANKKARGTTGDAQSFFRRVARDLLSLSGELRKAAGNADQRASSQAMLYTDNDMAVSPSSSSAPLLQRFMASASKKKLQAQIVLAGGERKLHGLARIIQSDYPTRTPSKTAERVIADSVIRSILWQWQQVAVKIQYASGAILSKAEELKNIEGMFSADAVAYDTGRQQKGPDTPVSHPGENDLDAHVRQWVNDSLEQAKPENQQAEKLAVLNKLLDGDIDNARVLVRRLRGKAEGMENLLRKLRLAVLNMSILRSGLDPSLRAVDDLLPDVASELAVSLAALESACQAAAKRDFAETETQAAFAQLQATKVKESLSAYSARLTERPLDEHSRGSRLAKHWAKLVREQNPGTYPLPDAGQVFSSLKKQGLLEGVLSAGDPEGYLFATRLAAEIENARNDELRLPMSPEQYTSLEKGLVEYIVKWGQKRVSRGIARIIIELSFEQGMDAVSFSVSRLFRVPYKILKASIKVPYNVNKINNYIMPGHDKPYKAIYDLLGKKLRQLGFNIVTAPVPGVIKLAAGAGIVAGAAAHNLYVGHREKTFSAVYQRVAEGEKSEKIKMASAEGMIFDSVIDSAILAVFKGGSSARQAGKAETTVVRSNEYFSAVNDENTSHVQLGREEIKVLHGVKLIVCGGRAFRNAVRTHIEEIQKHTSGRVLLKGLAGRSLEIRPPHTDDWFRKESDGKHYFGSRVVGNTIFFDPYNTYYGVHKNIDVEEWRYLDPSIVLFHELLHLYKHESLHETIVLSDPAWLDENDYRREFYESRNLNVVEREFSKDEGGEGQYASVSNKMALSGTPKIEKEIADALINHEAKIENKPVDDVNSAFFLDAYLYNRYLNSGARKDRRIYHKKWLRVRGGLKKSKSPKVKRYLDFRMIIESYNECKGYGKGYREYDRKRRRLYERLISLYKGEEPLDVGRYINSLLFHYGREFHYDKSTHWENNVIDIARIYYVLNDKREVNEIHERYLNIINSYLPVNDEIKNETKGSGVNIMRLIGVMDLIQKGHSEAFQSVLRVPEIVNILSNKEKSSGTLFTDARVIAAQVYDSVSSVSLVNNREYWLKRYDGIKQGSGNASRRLLHIEAIIYKLQRDYPEHYLRTGRFDSGLGSLDELVRNAEYELGKILYINNDGEKFVSFSEFKTRKELGNNDGAYYEQFDNYKDNNDAEKEAKRNFLNTVTSLRLSTGELFDRVEDVKVLRYDYINRDGGAKKVAPGRVIVIKTKESGAIVISNLLLVEHVRKISQDEYNKLSVVFNSPEKEDRYLAHVYNFSPKGVEYFYGDQYTHDAFTKILTGMDVDEIKKHLSKNDIWHGSPARFSNDLRDQEDERGLRGRTLRDAILRAKVIENNAAVSYLRSAMYSLTDAEQIAYRFVPFYEITHRSVTDREYEIDAEQFILDLATVITAVIPGVKGLSQMLRVSRLSSIIKSGLKGAALYKALGKELGRLGLNASKILGSAVCDLVDPIPLNPFSGTATLFESAIPTHSSHYFRSDWVDNNSLLGQINPGEDGVYKIQRHVSDSIPEYHYYIKKDNNFYPVRYDMNNKTWRLIPPEGSGKKGYHTPIRRNDNLEWEPHLDVDLRGGGVTKMLDSIRSKNTVNIGGHSFKRIPYNKLKLDEMRRIAATYTPKSKGTERMAQLQQEYKSGKEMSHATQYDFYNDLSFDEKLDLFISDGTDAKTRGVLAAKINETIKDITLFETAEAAHFWKVSARKSSNIVLVPQGIFLKGKSGECLPASVLMGRALQIGKEGGLINKLMGIHSVSDVGANPLYKLLMELHADGNSSRFIAREVSGIHVNTLMEARLQLFPMDNSFVRVDIPRHTMLMASVIKDGKVNYVFYDPNYGLAYFDKYGDMISFFKKKVREYSVPARSVKFHQLDYSRVQDVKINGKSLDDIIDDDNIRR